MYDKFPSVAVGSADECILGWDRIAANLKSYEIPLCIECYPGVLLDELQRELAERLPEYRMLRTEEAFLPASVLEQRFSELLTEDPVFGRMSAVEIADFFDDQKLETLRNAAAIDVRTIVLGTGATLVSAPRSLLVYADMARWELQRRQRSNLIPNLGMHNEADSPANKYKRAFFLDWRAADRAKQRLWVEIGFLLDTNRPSAPRMISGDAFRRAMQTVVTRPFRVVPFFDPGPWGGHWMESVCDLPDDGAPNHAWCFDCVPEENSLLLRFGKHQVEVPSLDLVLAYPRELLGNSVFERFGAEFPIRFDFLDTMGGGNLSLQVHPLKQYILEHFNMDYTQDESYYLLDAGPDAIVHLGLKDRVCADRMIEELVQAQDEDGSFNAEQYVNQFPARKHDHFLIPAGTIHCSGKNCMVLEISATPYIFTFKLWDWGRLGLNGHPRPIHLDHGVANIQWDRTTEWVRSSLVNQFVSVANGDGWREERTGLHPLEFIETRRHWFSKAVLHHTNGTVHVLNLVEGDEAVIESPDSSFEPLIVHYAETFIVPASVGSYSIRPHGPSAGKECATMLAYVRSTEKIPETPDTSNRVPHA